MPQVRQRDLEMQNAATELSSHRRYQSVAVFARPSRPTQVTHPEHPGLLHESTSELFNEYWRIEEPSSTAASSGTYLTTDETRGGRDTNSLHHSKASRVPHGGDETTVEPLLFEPGGPDLKPVECRKNSDLTAIGRAVLDLCITATSLYFLAFAIAASIHEGDLATSDFADTLLQAARFVSGSSRLLEAQCDRSY